MRITRRKAAKAGLACLLVVAFLVLRRGVLIVLLGLKILGHPGALDAWRGSVRHETVHHNGIPIDIYDGHRPGAPLLIVHGVNPDGKDSPHLRRIADALAQAGFRVFVPDFVEMKHQHLRPEETSRIKSIVQFIGQDAGIACFSYGCGPAMIAAADPEISKRVRFALSFGGYFDIRETLQFVVTTPESDIVDWKWVFVGANADLVQDEGDRSRLRAIAEQRAAGRFERDVEVVSPEAKALVNIFSAKTPDVFLRLLNAGPENLQARLDALSPSRFVQDIRAQLILVHGVNDSVIPAEQTVEFAEAARTTGLDYHLTLLGTHGHMNPVLPEIGMQSIFRFYVPEMFRFLGVVNRLVGMI
jgi:hypothetical protein